MWPWLIIKNIELIYWDLYQFDIQGKDDKSINLRFFINQSDLLKKLWKACEKSENISNTKKHIKQFEKAIEAKNLCFIKEDDSLMTLDEMKKELIKEKGKLNNLIDSIN
jgi:hypothetical protein